MRNILYTLQPYTAKHQSLCGNRNWEKWFHSLSSVPMKSKVEVTTFKTQISSCSSLTLHILVHIIFYTILSLCQGWSKFYTTFISLKNRQQQCKAQSISQSSVTLLLCELDCGVGVSLSWLVSIGDCGRNRRCRVGRWISIWLWNTDASDGAFNMFCYRLWVKDTFVSICFVSRGHHIVMRNLPRTTSAETSDGVVQQIHNICTVLSLCICWVFKFSVKEYGPSRDSNATQCNVCSPYLNIHRTVHSKPVEVFFAFFFWDEVPEVCVVQTGPRRPQSLQPCGWPPPLAHGWHLLGPHHTPWPSQHTQQILDKNKTVHR